MQSDMGMELAGVRRWMETGHGRLERCSTRVFWKVCGSRTNGSRRDGAGGSGEV